jgi:hypothetical protein
MTVPALQDEAQKLFMESLAVNHAGERMSCAPV